MIIIIDIKKVIKLESSGRLHIWKTSHPEDFLSRQYSLFRVKIYFASEIYDSYSGSLLILLSIEL